LYAPGVIKVDKIKRGDEVLITDKYGFPVGFGIARMSGTEMLVKKRGIAVETTVSVYKVPSLREHTTYKKGYFYDQSLPAILTSRILDPSPGEKILDMCAAPGGKTTHIAQLMGNTGKVIAVDRSKPRLRQLEEHVHRLGLKNVEIVHADGRKLAETYTFKVDKLLIDPPCSALGHRPKLYETMSVKNILNLSTYQKQFFKTAVKLVKDEGTIVYSTCTLTLEENELNVKYACEVLGLKLADQKYIYGSPGEPCPSFDETKRLQRFYPDLHDTPGFFIAKFMK